MVNVKLRGINKVRKRQRDGTTKIHYYHRATKTKLPDDPSSIQFIKRLNELNAQVREPSKRQHIPGTIGALIEHYNTSREFRSLSAKSRESYARYLSIIGEVWGKNRVAGIDREAVLRLRDAYEDTPRTANYIISVLSLLLTFAIDRPSTYGLRYNPAFRIKKIKTGLGHRPWEEDEIVRFRERWAHGTVQRTAFEIALNTGQRGIDIIQMEQNHLRADGTISVRQSKTGTRVWIPCSEELKTALAAWEQTRKVQIEKYTSRKKPVPAAINTMILFTEEKGSSFKPYHFRHVMGEAYRQTPEIKAGPSGGVTTHGLRYTAATILHELGNDWDEIASITGHETVQMVRKYTSKKRQAKIAISRLNTARKTTAKT